MDLTSLIIQLISGAIGGNAAKSAKDTGLGTLGNTIAGARRRCRRPDFLRYSGLGGTGGIGPRYRHDCPGFSDGRLSGGVTALVIGYLKAKFAA